MYNGFKYSASVIIPTYNRSELIKLTLNSLLNQSIDKNRFEVIVVDDGSTDNTKETVGLFSNKINIKYFYQEDKGFRVSTARNLGIKNSEGQIVIFIDSGIICGTRCIEEHIKSHEDTKELFAVIGYVYGYDDYNENEEILKGKINLNDIEKSIDILERDGILDLRENMYKQLGEDLTKWPAPWVVFWTANISVKRNILMEVGMFDENFNSWGGEDTDLGISLYTNGVKIVLNRKVKSIHYPHEKFKPQLTNEELKIQTLIKRKYIHNKYKLDSTNLWINTNSSDLNRILLDSKENI